MIIIYAYVPTEVGSQLMMQFGDRIDYNFTKIERISDNEYNVLEGSVTISSDIYEVLKTATSIQMLSLDFDVNYNLPSVQKIEHTSNSITFIV